VADHLSEAFGGAADTHIDEFGESVLLQFVQCEFWWRSHAAPASACMCDIGEMTPRAPLLEQHDDGHAGRLGHS
jgi:hypothetical protein